MAKLLEACGRGATDSFVSGEHVPSRSPLRTPQIITSNGEPAEPGETAGDASSEHLQKDMPHCRADNVADVFEQQVFRRQPLRFMRGYGIASRRELLGYPHVAIDGISLRFELLPIGTVESFWNAICFALLDIIGRAYLQNLAGGDVVDT